MYLVEIQFFTFNISSKDYSGNMEQLEMFKPNQS